MSVPRLFLIFVMAIIALAMAAYPGLLDSKLSVNAHWHFAQNPNEVTRHELVEAKKAEIRTIVIFELVMAGAFALTVYGFIRAGKNSRPNRLSP